MENIKNKFDEISRIYRNMEDEILKILDGIGVPDRTTLMLDEYISCLNNKCSWLKDILNFEDIYRKKEGREDSDTFKDVLKKISRNPSNKIIYIKKFLHELGDLTEQDIKALINRMKDMSMEELEKELKQLAEIFRS